MLLTTVHVTVVVAPNFSVCAAVATAVVAGVSIAQRSAAAAGLATTSIELYLFGKVASPWRSLSNVVPIAAVHA